jgi:hypothetical protein
MKNGLAGRSSLDIGIPGDELEQHRIELEHNLQHTDLSLHLSSVPDEGDPENSSVECPRHNSGPSLFPDFASLEYHSGDYSHMHHNLHALSYHTVDDDNDGLNPYAAETMSTAAHHASALTLSAGLAGRVTSRDISVSRGGYDSDMPLHPTMGADAHPSVIESRTKRSRSSVSILNYYHQRLNNMGLSQAGPSCPSPVVVGDTARLDRHAAPPSSLSICVGDQQFATGNSESDTSSSSSRPKLSDALRRVPFSPKRPHATQGCQNQDYSHTIRHGGLDTHPFPQPSPSQPLPSSMAVQTCIDIDTATPRPRARRGVSRPCISYQPEVRVHPPTPSFAGSEFTKLVKGLTSEIETQREVEAANGERNYKYGNRQRSSKSPGRNPFYDIVNRTHPVTPDDMHRRAHAPRRSSVKASRGRKILSHLPDVTGLTSAVASPARVALNCRVYHGINEGDGEYLYAIIILYIVDLIWFVLRHSMSNFRP